MDTRRQLVEEWKAKLAASSQLPADPAARFAWVRQIYTRIYRFLISSYSLGDWRGAGTDSGTSIDSPSTTSRMPFVDYRTVIAGRAPKSPEQIRVALDSIHAGNPGLATKGAMVGIDDDTWVVVAASEHRKVIRRLQRLLQAAEIEHRRLNRTTDIVIQTRHANFKKAIEVLRRDSSAD